MHGHFFGNDFFPQILDFHKEKLKYTNIYMHELEVISIISNIINSISLLIGLDFGTFVNKNL